jgi:hypothetical protein
MTLTTKTACWLALAACMVASASAQGKREKPPQKYYGEAVFRCPNTTSMIECTVPVDRIAGTYDDNEAAYPGLGWAGAGLFSGNSEMHIGLVSGGVSYYSIELDFGDLVGDRPCDATQSCRFPPYSGPIIVSNAEIQSNVVDADGAEVDGGLFSIPLSIQNTSAETRLKIGFRHPADTTLGWQLSFSATQYAGATHATVTRTGACTWVFEAGADDLAGLWSFGTIGGKGKSVRIDEGTFRMPVKLTFKAYDAPGCPTRPQ